jgi:hypothetical protein
MIVYIAIDAPKGDFALLEEGVGLEMIRKLMKMRMKRSGVWYHGEWMRWAIAVVTPRRRLDAQDACPIRIGVFPTTACERQYRGKSMRPVNPLFTKLSLAPSANLLIYIYLIP